MNDTIINKIQSIQRCIARAQEEYQKDPEQFETDFSRQDAAVLNIMRACEQSIDLANHIIKTYKMGIPSSSADSFDLLKLKNVIDIILSEQLKKMTQFRNLAVHQYQKLDAAMIKSILTKNLKDLILYTEKIIEFSEKNKPLS